MEMPITKPSLVSYADEMDFPKLIGEMAEERKNGFIRVTARSEEGYILFKDGKQVAASYDRYSKLEALEKITSALENANTLVEVFDVGPAQVDYLLDLNKPYQIEPDSNVYDVIGELKKTTETPEEPEVKESEVKESEVKESEVKESEVKESEVKESKVMEPEVEELEVMEPEVEELEVMEPEVKESEAIDLKVKGAEVKEAEVKAPEKPTAPIKEPSKQSESLEASMNMGGVGEVTSNETVEASVPDKKLITSEESLEDLEDSETSLEMDQTAEIPKDRAELLKKYGIKDVEEDDVENLLQSYKGGIIDDDDVEKVELLLMNLIKKSVLGIPKIKGAEVMVFLDNYKELSGTINIITEYENQGFLNRIVGQSRTASNLKRQIINISEIAIKKSFRQYPEVVDKFEINVEFS
ncbi:DUF2226 domain-containing protein [Methanobacterium ferruginis]|uniref:DUF2226 domain-containing protein n=1 Tax=Methanobacterium ferruginis TaxID=710191 RepID=UPI002573BC1C|nr:DUF2226 domain-containing protein [Methanobacterium ferruginis]BDZ69259.1 hypothetical protein GCM10025860_27070 [Methanobacterium ferruginis]